MAYAILLFDPEVARRAQAGEELDAFAHPPLAAAAVSAFSAAIADYGYAPDKRVAAKGGYLKKVGAHAIELRVFETEIAFSIAYGDGAEEAIFEALQDAAELCEDGPWAIYDPQTGEWSGQTN